MSRAVILVEGVSDRRAVEALAARQGRDLTADGVAVVAMGGVQAIGQFLERFGPRGSDVVLAGLYDVAEEPDVRRGLKRAGFASASSRLELEGSGSSRASMTSRTSSSARSAPRGWWTSWRSGVSSGRSGHSRSNRSGADGPSINSSGASSGTRTGRSTTRPCWSTRSISRGLRARWTRCSLTSEPDSRRTRPHRRDIGRRTRSREPA